MGLPFPRKRQRQVQVNQEISLGGRRRPFYRKRKQVITLSASQLKTANDCRRKRYFERVMKMPQPARGHQIFGTVLHAVIERYLRADATGRDRRGNPVDLYPEGWDTLLKIEPGGDVLLCDAHRQRSDARVSQVHELDDMERTMVKTLVAMAIEEGVIERRPLGQVEKYFEIPLNTKPEARIIGFMDYSDDVSVDDHKTTKSRRYLLSSNKLTTDLQMMIYAACKVLQLESKGGAMPDYIELAHNGFVKGGASEDPGVRKTRAKVTPQEVKEFWNGTVMPLVETILRDSEVTDPFLIPDPAPGACAAYGGCPYLGVCSRQESPTQYKKRVERLNDNTYKKLSEGNNMNLQDFLKNRQAAKSVEPSPAPQAAPAPAPRPAPTIEVESAPPVEAPSEMAPWAVAGCRACSGTGINSKGQMCRICVLKNRGIADRYKLDPGADGKIRWISKDALAANPIGSIEIVKPIADDERPAKQQVQVAPTVVVEDAPEEQVVIIQKPAEEPVTHRVAKPKSPVRGFGIFVKCSIHSPYQERKTTVESILEDMTVEDGKKYFEERDPWRRRDYLQRNSRVIAESLAGYHLYQLTSTPDGDVLVAALTAHAEMVVRGNV